MIPNTKVFVGSLPPGAKPEELRRMFEKYGVVTECDIMNRCGFVHMERAEMAEAAIQGLNNAFFKGQTISVEPGRMKERRGGGSAGIGGGGGGGGGAMHRGSGGGRGGSVGMNRGGGRSQMDGYGGGAMRRNDNRGGRSAGPYSRSGGGMDGYDRRSQYSRNDGGGMQYQSNDYTSGYGDLSGGNGSSYQGRYQSNSGNSGNGGYNQDRRGFALSDRQMFGGELTASSGGNVYTNDRSMMGGNAVGMSYMRGSNRYGGNDDSFERRGGSSIGGFDGQYSSPSQYSGSQGTSSGSVAGGSGGGRSYGSSSGQMDSYSRRAPMPDEYERSGSAAFNRYDFPPLGSSGNDMMMSRSSSSSAQQRRNMMPNQRY